jgi:transcriptional regulator with XRE-family HTH domain
LEREHLVQSFSRRLTQLIQNKGLGSEKSKAGVKLKELAEVSNCSHQMARRYAMGDALPDIDVTFKIAKWLQVSPGWLLFGEESTIPNNINQKNLIQIEPDLLEYILVKCAPLFLITKDTQELISFIMDIINDTTYIEADKKDILKIVDISIKSVMRFNKKSNDKRTFSG